MCTTIRLNGELIATYDELVRAVGVDAVVIDAADRPLRGDSCLCPIDIGATIERAGLTELEHDGDPMEHRLIRRTALDRRYLEWWKERWGAEYPDRASREGVVRKGVGEPATREPDAPDGDPASAWNGIG